tara:strand:+ start:3409 stop:4371 length:963 start_codon:yes stop_codon:yes gene_type:complete
MNYNYRISKTKFLSIILIPVFFVYAYLLISPYIEGDQYFYRLFYSALADAKFSEVMPMALEKVASVEPISIYILWIGAQIGFDKDIYISLLNVILLLGLFLFCRRHSVGPVPLFLLLTNYYIVVLMTGAERLKIAYIIIFWATLYTSNKGRALTGISGFAHLQNFIMFPSLLLAHYSLAIRRLLTAAKFKKEHLFVSIITIVFATLFFIIFNDAIIRKVLASIENSDTSIQILNLLILSTVAFFATRNRWRMALILLPMYPAVSILGGQRVNMIAVTLVLYFLIRERAINHPFVLALLLYFSFKSIPFIQNIIQYGSGFA